MQAAFAVGSILMLAIGIASWIAIGAQRSPVSQ